MREYALHTVVNVVEVLVGVLRVINDNRAPETIAVLSGQVTVVPESP